MSAIRLASPPEQEIEAINQTASAIEQDRLETERLEDQAVHLHAYSDYINRKVDAAKQLKRYIRPQDLWHYAEIFLKQNYPGTKLVVEQREPLRELQEVALHYDTHTAPRLVDAFGASEGCIEHIDRGWVQPMGLTQQQVLHLLQNPPRFWQEVCVQEGTHSTPRCCAKSRGGVEGGVPSSIMSTASP